MTFFVILAVLAFILILKALSKSSKKKEKIYYTTCEPKIQERVIYKETEPKDTPYVVSTQPPKKALTMFPIPSPRRVLLRPGS